MEITPIAGQTPLDRPAPAPPVPDKRPTADASAVTRARTPELPIASPPVKGQDGLIGAAMLREVARQGGELPVDKRVSAAERTLKPYGVTMLPSREDDATRPQAANDSGG